MLFDSLLAAPRFSHKQTGAPDDAVWITAYYFSPALKNIQRPATTFKVLVLCFKLFSWVNKSSLGCTCFRELIGFHCSN